MSAARELVACVSLIIASTSQVFCENSEQPFDVSLWSSSEVNLSACYQQIVREATERYRGDLVETVSFIVLRTYNGKIVYSRDKFFDTPSITCLEFENGLEPFP